MQEHQANEALQHFDEAGVQLKPGSFGGVGESQESPPISRLK